MFGDAIAYIGGDHDVSRDDKPFNYPPAGERCDSDHYITQLLQEEFDLNPSSGQLGIEYNSYPSACFSSSKLRRIE